MNISFLAIDMPPNVESLRLYRDILRATRSFTWCNEKGEPWRDILRNQARNEFEQARHESDPVLIARMLFVGRDCLVKTMHRLEDTANKMTDHVDKTRNH